MKHLAMRTLMALSLTLLAYVAYAHFASWRRSGEYGATPLIVDFASASELAARFETRASPGLAASVEGGAMRVRGECERAGASLVLLGKPTRLLPSRVRARVRVREAAPIDVMVGVERVDGPPRELRFGGAVIEGAVEARLVGDLAVRGARTEGDRVLVRASEINLGLGVSAAMHDIALGLEPDLLTATALVDGMAVRTHAALWEAGVLVRPAISVTCRDPAPNVDVELAQVAWEPIVRDTTWREIDDRFSGRIIDTRWRVSRADPEQVETTVLLGQGRGLELSTKARRATSITQGLSLISPRMRAEPFHASFEVHIEHVKQGTLYLGVSNPYVGLAFFRTLDVGVYEKDGGLVPFTSGHFTNDAQAAFRTHEKAFGELPAASNGKVVLELAFDPATRKAHAKVNGVTVSDEVVALQPFEDIVLHVGVNSNGVSSESQVRFERVRFVREAR